MSNPSRSSDHDLGKRGRSFRARSGLPLALVFVVVVLGAVGSISWFALVTAFHDVLRAAVILAPSILAGMGVVSRLWPAALPRRWQALLGATLGLGLLSTAVLIFGLMGIMDRWFWNFVLVGGGIAGTVSLLTTRAGIKALPPDSKLEPPVQPLGGLRWLILLVCPFCVIGLLAATTPPGLIWVEEGFGYDILEYHLQAPREYLQTGRIAYLPHNVYASFPSNMEMLYLLAMIVHNEVYDIGTVTNMIHLAFGALAVWAAWVIGCDRSGIAGLVGAVAMGSTGWLVYLSGLAYVENGLLFYGLVSGGLLLRGLRAKSQGGGYEAAAIEMKHADLKRWTFLSGVSSGFACGCKYTALAMVVAPLVLAYLFASGRQRPGRLIYPVLFFLVGTVLGFSPWLVKNTFTTGSPVFPLLNTLFAANPPGWSDAQTEQWDRSHRPGPEEESLIARAQSLWQRIAADPMQRFGPAVLLLGWIGLWGRKRDAQDSFLAAMCVWQLLAWLLASHLFARFAIPLLIPLALLAGRSAGAGGSRRRMSILICLILGSLWNLLYTGRWAYAELPGDVPSEWVYEGRIPGQECVKEINDLDESTRTLLVGEARAFYFQRDVVYCVAFNQNEFFEALESSNGKAGAMRWLTEKGITHILIHWNEVRRLSSTYGFSPPMSPERLAEHVRVLTDAGLRLIRDFRHPSGRAEARFVELYEVPVKGTQRGPKTDMRVP